MLLRTCPTYVSSYSYIRVLVLLHARPHTAIYVSSYSNARVLILPCVLILLSSLHRRHLSWHSHTCVVAESRLHCGNRSIQILSGPRYGSWGRWRHNKIQGEKVWEGETVFLTGRVTSHEGMYKKPTSESALRAYDPTISILSSNKLRFKIRRCRVDAARHSTIELTWQVKLWRDSWFLCRWDLTTSQPTVRFIKALNLAVKQACTCLFMLCLLHLFGY